MKYPLLLAAPAALFAADASQTIIDRAQQATPPPPAPTAPAGIEVSPGDLDAGNQRVAQRREVPFKLSVTSDTQVYYTDNIQLASPGTAKEDAYVFSQTLALNGQFRSLAPRRKHPHPLDRPGLPAFPPWPGRGQGLQSP